MPVPKGTRIGGRQKGSKNKSTMERERHHDELVAKAKAEGLTPLEHMLNVLRDHNADDKRRDAMAVAAAQYMHPRLAAIDVKAEVDATVEVTTIELVAPSVLLSDDHTAH